MSEYNKKRKAEDDNENKKRKAVSDLSEDEYEVERIEKHHVVNGEFFYCVKWKGYDDRTWEPSKNLNNCPDILKEYKLTIKSKRQQEEQNKKSPTTKGTGFINQDQRVVSVKNARTINYVKFYSDLKHSLPDPFITSSEDNDDLLKVKKKEGPRNNLNDASYSNMPLEVRLPPFGPGDRSIILKNRKSNKSKEQINKSPVNSKLKWRGIIYRIRNKEEREERKIGTIQITNHIGNSMDKFPYLDRNQNQFKLIIDQFVGYKNSVIEDLIKDSSNYVNGCAKFPVYVASVATSLSEELTELDYLQSYLSKKQRVGVINAEKWTLYLLPTTKEFCDVLYVEKPKNVDDLYFVLQFPKNEIAKSSPSSTLSSCPNVNSNSSNLGPAKKHNNSVFKAQDHEKTQQDNISPSIQSLSCSPRTSNKEIPNNLDEQSSFKKRKNSTQQYDKMQQNDMPPRTSFQTLPDFNGTNKEISNNSELQLPPAKKHKNSIQNDLISFDKMQQNKEPSSVQSNFNPNKKISGNLDLPSKKHRNSEENQQSVIPSLPNSSQTIIEDKSSDLPIKFKSELKDFFETSNFVVIGSQYIESQKVISYLKNIGSNEVVIKDPRMNCILFHQNDITQGFSFKNFLIYKNNQTRFFSIIKKDDTITLQEIILGGVILVTSTAIKNTDNIIDSILYFTNLVNGWDFKIHPNILSYLQRLLTFLSGNEFLRVRLDKAFKSIVNGLISGNIKYLLPNEMPLDDYNMDSRKLTFDSMECLSKTNYNKYHRFVVIDDTDEIDEQYVENEKKGIETMTIEKFKQKFVN
ncbi:hypothetical protein RclHR1_01820003 [Rhizophagus clarus]|uniref:Chromobox protein homolog 1-like n=1 Tax=Rhizophagus clarus TaxID=94130 RepID=A0A2Z6R0E0_9GLOM|nr:hypothetical protein RclHR1_01820003 [Rhizophagus clarus]GES92415.1 chromobox protein homolog 1-like [Rhizophagus clarus]